MNNILSNALPQIFFLHIQLLRLNVTGYTGMIQCVIGDVTMSFLHLATPYCVLPIDKSIRTYKIALPSLNLHSLMTCPHKPLPHQQIAAPL